MKQDPCVCLEDYFTLAKKMLPKDVFVYINSGSDQQITKKRNHRAFANFVMIPRILRDADNIEMSSELFGKRCSVPFGFAPWAMNKIVHPQGERIPARIASKYQLPYILSILSNTSLTDISKQNAKGPKMLQLYICNNFQKNMKLIAVAQKNDFDGIVITVDAQVLGTRRAEERHKLDLSSYQFPLLEQIIEGKDDPKQRVSYLKNRDLTLNWDTIAKIRAKTKLKIILKGIMNPKDAAIATDYCDAIYLSNHGGRQLDTTPATIEILPAIVASVRNKKRQTPIFIDGGILTGNDIFKAIGLGANFVFVGRPLAYSLVRGQKGVDHLVQILKDELKRAMILNGTVKLEDINVDTVRIRSKL